VQQNKSIKDEKLEIVFQPNFRFALNKKATKMWTINPRRGSVK